MKARTALWWFMFTGFAVNYIIRININIAIVSMVRTSRIANYLNQSCISASIQSENILAEQNKIDLLQWNEYERGMVLSSFFWLHWTMALPGGLLGHYYGTKRVFGLSNLLVALLSFFIPTFALIDFKWVIAIRVLQGICAGSAWPSMLSMIARWAPPHERAKFASAYLGSSVGVAITYLWSGFVIDNYGWQYVFYTTGAIGVFWCLCWHLYVYDNPQDHPRLTDKERNELKFHTAQMLNDNNMKIPWKEIATCRPFIMTVIAQWASSWSVHTLLTHTPTFLKFIHGLDIKTTGALCGLPYLTRWIFSFIFASFADYLIREGIISTTNVRKLATAVFTIIQSIFIIWLAYSGCDTVLAISLMLLAITIDGSVSSGPYASLIDLSPNFSSVLQGINNTITLFPAFISPLIVGWLTYEHQTPQQWQKVYLITATMSVVCGSLYVVFGKSEIQKWNEASYKIENETHALNEVS